MKRNHISLALFFLTAATAMLPGVIPASAADPAVATGAGVPAAAEATNGWRFAATLPLWAPQINGNATLRGQQKDVDVSFSELKDHLDASFALGLSAQKDRFGLFGNVGYMKFSGSSSDELGGKTDADLKFVVANAGMSYDLVKTESEHPFLLTATAGVRYWYVSTDIEHRDFNGQRDFHAAYNDNLFDPVIGLRATQYFTQKLHLDIAGDGGGFNLSHDTDWTWSLSAMLSYDFTKWFSLSAGYQALALDQSQGSGSSENGVDLVFSGVAAALTFKF